MKTDKSGGRGNTIQSETRRVEIESRKREGRRLLSYPTPGTFLTNGETLKLDSCLHLFKWVLAEQIHFSHMTTISYAASVSNSEVSVSPRCQISIRVLQPQAEHAQNQTHHFSFSHVAPRPFLCPQYYQRLSVVWGRN